jgi:HSP20 family molecular chaperone IbpA
MTELEKKEQKEVTTTSAEQLKDIKNAYKPDVDIYYGEDKLFLAIDMPGVKKGDVSIEINENNTLVVKAKSSFVEPEGALYKQFKTGNYYRAFNLSDEFDKEKLSGNLENGVLEIIIPRKEEVKARKVEIKV